MSRTAARSAVVLAAALVAALPAGAQRRDACEGSYYNSDRASHCEVRELTLGARRLLAVDGRQNGGVSVEGWDRNEIRVRAKVVAQASTDAEAQAIAAAVRIDDRGQVLQADGPETAGTRGGWSVSYEIMVPRNTDLELEAHNGGLSLANVAGRVAMRTVNGGIKVENAAGDVRGSTSNGGISVDLAGARWEGQGLDLETSNGGVTIAMPRGYSATLETGTVNGSLRLDVPITVQGRIERHIRTELGRGGPLVRAVTTNGGVRVTER
jgi:hypothetical protein